MAETTRTASIRCLDFVFAVETSDPVMTRLLDELYEPLRTDEAPRTMFMVACWPGTDHDRYAIYRDGERRRDVHEPALALAHLVWEINQAALEHPPPGLVLLHAGAVEISGKAVLLPGRSGAGKSTLVAALVADGFGYLTDDLTVIDVDSGLVIPHPRPLSVARRLWADLGVDTPDGRADERYLGDEGFLTGQSLGRTSTEPAMPAAIVSPIHRDGAPARFEPVTPDECRELLASQIFEPAGSRGIARLDHIAETCAAGVLEYSDIADGVDTVRHEFGR